MLRADCHTERGRGDALSIDTFLSGAKLPTILAWSFFRMEWLLRTEDMTGPSALLPGILSCSEMPSSSTYTSAHHPGIQHAWVIHTSHMMVQSGAQVKLCYEGQSKLYGLQQALILIAAGKICKTLKCLTTGGRHSGVYEGMRKPAHSVTCIFRTELLSMGSA